MYIILLTGLRISIVIASIYMFFYLRKLAPITMPKTRFVLPFAISATMVTLGFEDATSTITISFMYIFIACFIYDVFLRTLSRQRYFYIKFHHIFPILIAGCYISFGVYNAQNIQRTDYTIETNKLPKGETITMVALADTHLNSVFGSSQYIGALKEIESLKPDMLLLVGDIYEEATIFNDMQTLGKAIGALEFKYGTYYVYGNHDTSIYRRNPRKITEVSVRESLESNGITVLKDEVLLIDDKLYLAGRMDKTVDKERADIADILADVDKTKPIIVLDHQPISLRETVEAGGDLVLSGHTHDGQVFPLGLITRLRGHYDIVYGAMTVGDTTMIVTSGMGVSETILRTDGISEYIFVTLVGV